MSKLTLADLDARLTDAIAHSQTRIRELKSLDQRVNHLVKAVDNLYTYVQERLPTLPQSQEPNNADLVKPDSR